MGVELLLGPAEIISGSRHLYSRSTDSISIRYVKEGCESKGGWWNVPIDTVEEIEVIPMADLIVNDLHFDLSKYRKTESRHPEDSFYYHNADDGIFIRTRLRGSNEEVMSITYGRANRYRDLRCKRF